MGLPTSNTFLTSLFSPAIDAAKNVNFGGAYFTIFRHLNIDTVGAIAVPLVMTLALSIELRTMDFTESLVGVFPRFDEKRVAIITTSLVASVAIRSVRERIKTIVPTTVFVLAGVALAFADDVL